jgi:Heterokaryon incompatibility protein (HET)
MTEFYQHIPLRTEQSIRVLKLAPALHRDSSLRCKLVEVSLDKNPKYEALSYVWGSPQNGCYIECYGLKFRITANAEAALRRLRYRCCPRTLWIDAICINQTSIPEKNTQLRLMADIYRKARRVIIWLGEGSEMLDLAFRSFREFEILSKMMLPEQLLRMYVERWMATGLKETRLLRVCQSSTLADIKER